eukprot:1159566-Pelagomonas_calceolata.AAC.30
MRCCEECVAVAAVIITIIFITSSSSSSSSIATVEKILYFKIKGYKGAGYERNRLSVKTTDCYPVVARLQVTGKRRPPVKTVDC